MKLVFLNGQLVPSEKATVSVFDRGFLYGDGLFETLRVRNAEPVWWDEHWTRLKGGADFLRIGLPCDSVALRKHVDKLLQANECSEAVLRIHLSRGVGPRGYSPREAQAPVLVMSTHPLPATPEGWKLATTSFRLPALNPLSAFKTSNKLVHILARAEAEQRGADEGLLLTDSGELAEGTSSNLFWIANQTIFTPPDEAGILPGITRAAVLRACNKLNLPIRQTTMQAEGLERVEGAFMTLSTHGVIEATELNGRALNRSPLTQQIKRALHD